MRKSIQYLSVLLALLVPTLAAHAVEDVSWGSLKSTITGDTPVPAGKKAAKGKKSDDDSSGRDGKSNDDDDSGRDGKSKDDDSRDGRGRNKVDICHYSDDDGLFRLISVSAKAVDKHLANHGDSYPGTYYTDGDGDGFGDPDGATDVCGNPGFVANNLDSDDADAAINPDADEVCGDGVDNNSDGQVDEDCIEICGDGVDNNGDGQVDEGCVEVCGDGVDNNGDGQVDEDCAATCPDGSTEFEGHCYAPGGNVDPRPDGNLWLAADTYCADTYGGHVVSVNSQGENDLVGFLGGVMIGFSDEGRPVNDFAWYDGSAVTYTNWAPNEPSNNLTGRGYENCAQRFNGGASEGMWNDVPCTDGGPYVCEFSQ